MIILISYYDIIKIQKILWKMRMKLIIILISNYIYSIQIFNYDSDWILVIKIYLYNMNYEDNNLILEYYLEILWKSEDIIDQ